MGSADVSIFDVLAWLVYSACILVTFILGIVFFLIKGKYTKRYIKSALILSSFITGLSLISMIIAMFFDQNVITRFGGVFILPINFLVLIIYVATGSFFCARLGHPNMPLLRKKGGVVRSWKFYFNIAAAATAVIAFSSLLFMVTHPSETSFAKDAEAMWRQRYGLDTQFGIVTVFFLIGLAAIVEEIVFRLFLQNMIGYFLKWARGGYVFAIAATSVIWALAHSGVVDPGWVKFVQVVVIGIVLGFLMRKQGVESCMAVHVAMNFSFPLLARFFE